MKRLLRKVFGGHMPSVHAVETESFEYDPTTQEMIALSVKLLEHMLSQGQDLTRERLVQHFFIGDNRDIQRAVRQFQSDDFLAADRQADKLSIAEQATLTETWVW